MTLAPGHPVFRPRLKLFPLRVAILKLARVKRLHIIRTLIFRRVVSAKAAPLCGFNTHKWQGISSAGWCAACCKLPNMTMEFHNSAGGRAGKAGRRFYGTNISKYLCGIFDLLWYIPALLTNRN
jgi:hypothetical protein